MFTRNANTCTRRHVAAWISAIAAGLLAVNCRAPQTGLTSGLTAASAPTSARQRESAAPGLVRSADVIRAKIERKQKKIEQGQRESRAQNPDKALEERRMSRLGDDGTVRANALMLAKRQAEMVPELSITRDPLRDAGIWDWEWLGPGNIGGRIRSILIHPDYPNTMFVGGVAGGIWKTTNGGASWAPINDFLPSLAISSMVMDPDDPDVIYAGTGEGFPNFDALPGAGVFKSTNGGASWEQLAATIPAGAEGWHPWAYVSRLAIRPNDGNTLVAATNQGLYRTTDAGVTWQQRKTGWAKDVKFSPGFSNRLVAGFWGTVWYSDNAGLDWYESTFSTAFPIGTTSVRVATTPDGDNEDDTLEVNSTAAFNGDDVIDVGGELLTIKKIEDSNTLIVTDMSSVHAVGELVESQRCGRVEVAWGSGGTVYASMDVGGGVLWRSYDMGQTFSMVANAADTPDYVGGQGWFNNCLWIDPNDSQFIVVGGIDVYRSATGGTNLERISDWTRYHDEQDSAHADHHILVPHPDWPTNRTFFSGNDGGIQKVDNIQTAGTTDWVNLANNLGITQFYGGSAAPDGSVIVGGTQDNDNLRWRPEDGAQDWYQAETGDGGFCAINPDNPNIIYAEYWGLRIEKSTNGGATYTRMHDGITEIGEGLSVSRLVMDPNDPETLYAGGPSLWRTTNGAASWSAVKDPIASEAISAIEIAPTSSEVIWVGYSKGALYRSINGGVTWMQVDDDASTPLPDRYVTDIAINPSNPAEVLVTIGGYAGDTVWLTSDHGDSWEQRTGSGEHTLPEVQVNTVRYHPYFPGWVYIGTDLGIYASEDTGLTWSRSPRYGDHEGPVNTEVFDLFWQGEYLVAATHGRGMYRCLPAVGIFVDWSNTGTEDGSYQHPYNTVAEAAAAASDGTDIHISGGDYNETEPLVFQTRGRVTGYNGTVTIR